LSQPNEMAHWPSPFPPTSTASKKHLLDLMASRVIGKGLLLALSPGATRAEHDLVEAWVVLGEWVYRKLGRYPYQPPPLGSDTPEDRKLHLRNQNLALGWAWLKMAIAAGRFDPRILRREYREIVEGSLSVSGELNRYMRRRARYRREAEQRISRREQKWRDDLREWLVSTDSIGREMEEHVLAKVWYEEFIASLSSAERETLVDMLTGQPTSGAADRKRRSRLRHKLRSQIG
jgi:hypothetical protein